MESLLDIIRREKRQPRKLSVAMSRRITENIAIFARIASKDVDGAERLAMIFAERAVETLKDINSKPQPFTKILCGLDESGVRINNEEMFLMALHNVLSLSSWAHFAKTSDDAWDAICSATETATYMGFAHVSAKQFKKLDLLRYKNLGKLGASVRHAKTRQAKEFAISLYRSGAWKSANAAAHAIRGDVVNFVRRIGGYLSEENAQRTIAEWIRASLKNPSSR